MTDGVTKLKELLFDSEKATLADLERRIEAVAVASTNERVALSRELEQLAGLEAEHRTQIAEKVEEVFGRAGTQERFRDSVAQVIDGALRTAEIERHDELSQAVAPLVVQTIKTEINNSQDELVEALYPITGRLVKSYVASAIKDMMDQINRRLESNPTMLRLRSLTTGRSAAELALIETQTLEVEEIYLIRRGSGELIARWPDVKHAENRDHVMSGVLTAINEFATEAFASAGSALRQIDLGASQIYLRASPTFLLAAKCSGTAPAAVEQIIDEEVLGAIERYSESSDEGTDEQSSKTVLAGLSQTLQTRIQEKQDELKDAASGGNPLGTVAWIAGLILAAWLSWTLYESYNFTKTHAVASTIIGSASEMRGYPTRLSVAPYGATVAIAGLAPTDQAKDKLVADLRLALRDIPVQNHLRVINSAGPELERLERDITSVRVSSDRKLANLKSESSAELDRLRETMQREAVQRATDRTARRLDGLPPVMTQLASITDGTGQRARIDKANAAISAATARLQNLAIDAGITSNGQAQPLAQLSAPITDIRAELAKAFAELSAVLGEGTVTTESQLPANDTSASIVDQAEDLAIAAERLSTLAVATAKAAAVKPAPAEPTLREKLEAFAKSRAVFFATGTDYRDNSQTAKLLDELAVLAKQGDHLIRVIGYTDDRGAADQNTPLSRQRAEKVYNALRSRGVPARQLVAVGRTDALDLSPIVGEASPNRRVQFEIGFEGERLGSQR